MFKLNQIYEPNRDISKFDYIRYSPLELSKTNTANSPLDIYTPSVISLLKSYSDIKFNVLHAATNNRYANDNDRRLVSLDPIALFGSYKFTTSSGKNLEKNSHAHFVSLMYKVITSSRGFDDLFSGFDLDSNRRQRDLTNNNTQRGKFYLRFMLRDLFGSAEHQEKATFGLEDKLTLTRSTDNSVLNRYNTINKAKKKSMIFNGMYHIIHYQFPNKL